MLSTIAAGKQAPLTPLVTILRPHSLASRMCRDDIRVALLVEGLVLSAEFITIHQTDNLSGHLGRVVSASQRIGSDIPTQRPDFCREAGDIGRGVIGAVVHIA